MISIVIPVYNGADYLREAIDSALAQTYPNIEIIVVNDGSRDDGATEKIARSYGEKIRYFSKENGGVASALNFAVNKMTGDYFSWLSHDDLYFPNKIESQIDALSVLADRERTILYSDHAALYTDKGGLLQEVRLPDVPPEQFRYFITTTNLLHGCTLLIPKAAFDECGLFDEKLRTTQDYDLWFRMAGRFRFVHLPEVLVKGRVHAAQGSHALKHTAHAEINRLLAGFASSLTEQELGSATNQSLCVAYANISANFRRRGFIQAADDAVQLSRNAGRHCSSIELVKSFLIISFSFPRTIIHRIQQKVRNVFERLKKMSLAKRSQDLKKKFSDIYSTNAFKGSVSRSGAGSDLVQTAEVRLQLPALVKEFDIRTFLDAPCGDWFWMRETNMGVEKYIGADIVPELIEKNTRQFASETNSFICMNLAEDIPPQVDLIFCRDCLVHLSYDDIRRVIGNFKDSKSKYLLTTTFTDRLSNEDLGNKMWRPLNLQRPPFNFPEPLKLINEKCTEADNRFTDKSLGLWKIEDLPDR